MSGLPPRIRALLWEHTSLVIATERDGHPWIASVFYAPEDTGSRLELVCALLASSRKLADLRVNPRVAVFIGPREPSRWLQAEGVAAIVEEPGAAAEVIARLTNHAPAARVFIDRVPVVPVIVRMDAIKLTDLTGTGPPVEQWVAPLPAG